ncbi:MAG: extracellular solute-binding protein, partial [Chloroflexi bacterium]|nr:extracellular solute-binding protein [Chloroflexota bacterium]
KLVQFGSDALLVHNLLVKKVDTPAPQIVLLESSQNRQLGQNIQMTPLKGYYEHPLWGLEAQQIPAIHPIWLKSLDRSLPLWELPALLFYNDTYGRQLGFDSPPQTQEELEKQMCAAAVAINNDDDPDNNGTGGWIISGSADAFLSWVASRTDLESAVADTSLKQFGKQFTETLTWLQGLKDQGCIWPSRLSEPYDYFASHQALVYSGTLADIKNQTRAFSHNQVNSTDDWSLIPYPAKSGSTQVLTDGVEISILMGTAEEQFASWLFLSWLLKGDNALRLAVAADGWPVQSDIALDKTYREMTMTQNYAALQYRDIALPAPYPENWQVMKEVMSDGVRYFFSAYSKITDSGLIWEQIQATVNEIIDQSP